MKEEGGTETEIEVEGTEKNRGIDTKRENAEI